MVMAALRNYQLRNKVEKNSLSRYKTKVYGFAFPENRSDICVVGFKLTRTFKWKDRWHESFWSNWLFKWEYLVFLAWKKPESIGYYDINKYEEHQGFGPFIKGEYPNSTGHIESEDRRMFFQSINHDWHNNVLEGLKSLEETKDELVVKVWYPCKKEEGQKVPELSRLKYYRELVFSMNKESIKLGPATEGENQFQAKPLPNPCSLFIFISLAM